MLIIFPLAYTRYSHGAKQLKTRFFALTMLSTGTIALE